jgi:hypothetical protein
LELRAEGRKTRRWECNIKVVSEKSQEEKLLINLLAPRVSLAMILGKK